MRLNSTALHWTFDIFNLIKSKWHKKMRYTVWQRGLATSHTAPFFSTATAFHILLSAVHTPFLILTSLLLSVSDYFYPFLIITVRWQLLPLCWWHIAVKAFGWGAPRTRSRRRWGLILSDNDIIVIFYDIVIMIMRTNLERKRYYENPQYDILSSSASYQEQAEVSW